jgi:tetratricopeptide (TPR) repeat protein
MRNYAWLATAAILFLFASCKSGEKLYNKGRYDDAVAAFVKKLQRKPDDEVARQLLPKAYDQSVRLHEDKVNGYLRSDDPLKWESVRREYRSLQHLYDIIYASPAAQKVVQPKDYRNAITGAQESAAQVRYERGMQLLDRGDKPSARDAYDEFAAALKMVNNYRDARQRMDEAFQLGTVNVVVSRLDVRSPFYQFSADQFRDALVRNLQQRSINRFVRFTDERFARGENIRPDEYLEMQFYDFEVGQTYVDRFQREVSREIEAGSVKDTSGKYIKRYETVKATIYIVKKTVVSRGLLDYRIVDVANNRVLRQDRIPGSYTWLNQVGTFRGDERALSDEDKRQMGGRDLPPPPPQELFMLFTQPIYDQLARDLQNFYSQVN